MQRSLCPISSTLDIAGDRWTFVILRDMLTGKSRYAQFLQSPERITTNVLAARLKEMEQNGLVTKTPYQTKPMRYEYALSEKGRMLQGVLQQMCLWANRYVPGTWEAPEKFMQPVRDKR